MAFSVKDITASKDSFYYVPLESIKVQDGFNVRKDFGDIPGLAMDIAANGLTQPLIVRLAPDEKCVYLDDGERRFRAINYINSNNLLEGGVHDVKCILENKGTNEEARILKMFSTGSNSKPLTDMEQAECLYRLSHVYHMTNNEIGKRIGRPVVYVRGLLELHGASFQIREAVKNKKISSTAAVKLAKASEVVQAKVLSGGASKKKIKVKDVERSARGVPFMISSKSILAKIERVKEGVKVKGRKVSLSEYEKALIKGLELALGLWELK
jgi:ParB-like chromosome segregation protein Spo0J